jgi:hypothetical protein
LKEKNFSSLQNNINKTFGIILTNQDKITKKEKIGENIIEIDIDKDEDVLDFNSTQIIYIKTNFII